MYISALSLRIYVLADMNVVNVLHGSERCCQNQSQAAQVAAYCSLSSKTIVSCGGEAVIVAFFTSISSIEGGPGGPPGGPSGAGGPPGGDTSMSSIDGGGGAPGGGGLGVGVHPGGGEGGRPTPSSMAFLSVHAANE